MSDKQRELRVVELLGSWIPQPLPAGWSSPQDAVVRVNSIGKGAVFGRLLTTDKYRVHVQGSPLRLSCWATLSNTAGSSLTEEEVAEVASALFPGVNVAVRWILPAFVLLELPDRP